MSSFNKGIVYIIIGSFWWGVIGVIYFRSVSSVGSIELVLHRVVWTAAMLIITTLCMSKWTKLKKIFKNKKKLTYLTITGFLIFINWSEWPSRRTCWICCGWRFSEPVVRWLHIHLHPVIFFVVGESIKRRIKRINISHIGLRWSRPEAGRGARAS